MNRKAWEIERKLRKCVKSAGNGKNAGNAQKNAENGK